jgi:hypothetical protein
MSQLDPSGRRRIRSIMTRLDREVVRAENAREKLTVLLSDHYGAVNDKDSFVVRAAMHTRVLDRQAEIRQLLMQLSHEVAAARDELSEFAIPPEGENE